MNLKDRANRLKTDIPAIVFALKDRDTPLAAKILAAIAVAYALSPIDLIPDFIPVIGYLDDVILLPILIAATVRLIPEEIMERNRKQAELFRERADSGKWYYAIPIVVIWLILILLIVKAIGWGGS